MLQVEALEILKTGSNVFLTGVPGAGKTYVINQYVKWLEQRGIYPSITASTGIAATHVGGSTIHSFSGIGIEKHIDEHKLEKIMEREKLVKKIQGTNVLIIDEISMLDAQTLDNVNTVLKGIKDPTKAFGGVQIIFVGDFFQLPPVTRQGEYKNYAFVSKSWKEARPLTCYLEEQFRQTDEKFTKLLLAIRENNIDEMHVEILEEIKRKTFKKLGLKEGKNLQEGEYEEESVSVGEEEERGTTLTPLPSPTERVGVRVLSGSKFGSDILELHSHNKNVDEINDAKLTQLVGKEFIFKMITQGRASLVENLIKSCLSPENLKLKKGAKVIFTKNSVEGEYVNGTLGVVQDLDNQGIVIETKSGKIIDLKHEEWKVEDDGKVLAKISQYPLRLAWAITVHKSQGMSLDEAIISLGETFEYGQGYVALSRLRSLEGLYLKSYNPKSLQINSAISEFDEKIRKDSSFIQNKFLKAATGKLESLQKDFVKKCRGVWEGGVQKQNKNMGDEKSTEEKTHDLISAGKNLDEICDIRQIKFESILKHIEVLYKKEKLTKLEISKVVTINIFNIPNEVKQSFKKNKLKIDEEGKIKLSPVFKELKEKYPYEELRVYRLFVEV